MALASAKPPSTELEARLGSEPGFDLDKGYRGPGRQPPNSEERIGQGSTILGP